MIVVYWCDSKYGVQLHVYGDLVKDMDYMVESLNSRTRYSNESVWIVPGTLEE